MKKPKFDDLMTQLSQEAEQERTAEAALRVRLAKRKRILSAVATGTVVLLGATAAYFHTELRAYFTPPAATPATVASGTSTGAPPAAGIGTMSRTDKLKMTVTEARENAALVDNIMDNVPDHEVGKLPVVASTNAAEAAAANGRGSLKTAMVNAKNHAALIDSIMDGKTPPTNAVAPRH